MTIPFEMARDAGGTGKAHVTLRPDTNKRAFEGDGLFETERSPKNAA
jgi:hypothetical protein